MSGEFDLSKCDFEFAKILEEAERYEDMVQVVAAASLEGNSVLTTENRNLLSVAFKNVVGSRRSAWRVYNAEANRDKYSPDIIKSMKETVEAEIFKYCDQVLSLIDESIMKKIKALPEENKSKKELEVFFHKMSGDYYRYKCEVATSKDRGDFQKKAGDAYEEAKKASNDLNATHPIRLGLLLNYSVFKYEIMEKPKEACELAKEGFDQAISELDENEPNHKDSSLIMQLLRDNLTLWTASLEDPEDTEDN